MIIYLSLLDSESEQDKFTRLYLAYRGVMYHTAVQILGDCNDSEDVVHQAFIKIIEHFSQVKEPVSPSTRAFVLIITRCTAIDLYRKRKTHSTISIEHISDVAVEGGIDHLIDGNSIAIAIANLPDRYRDLFFLKYDYGLSNHEIAHILEIKEVTVRKWLERGRKMLEQNLNEQGVAL